MYVLTYVLIYFVVWGECNHVFHKHCIDKWLGSNKENCPMCRQKWVEQKEGELDKKLTGDEEGKKEGGEEEQRDG